MRIKREKIEIITISNRIDNSNRNNLKFNNFVFCWSLQERLQLQLLCFIKKNDYEETV